MCAWAFACVLDSRFSRVESRLMTESRIADVTVNRVTTEARIRAHSKSRGTSGGSGRRGGRFGGSRCSLTTWTCTKFWSRSEKARTDECSKEEGNMLARCVASRREERITCRPLFHRWFGMCVRGQCCAMNSTRSPRPFFFVVKSKTVPKLYLQP